MSGLHPWDSSRILNALPSPSSPPIAPAETSRSSSRLNPRRDECTRNMTEAARKRNTTLQAAENVSLEDAEGAVKLRYGQ